MFKHPGSITKGLGKLSPQVWRGLMDTAQWVLSNKRDLDSLLRQFRDNRYRVDRPWFLARLTKAKRKASNQYIYAWERVQLTGSTEATAYEHSADADFTSTSGSDDFAFHAINLMEANNTDGYAAPGVDMDEVVYPSSFFMNPIGGAASAVGIPTPPVDTELTLQVSPIVPMWFIRNPSGSGFNVRYVFCASNAHDGDSC